MNEVQAVAHVWGEEIGNNRIKRLVEPTLQVIPRRGEILGTTGLYCRSYNRAHREHQYNLLIYRSVELRKDKKVTHNHSGHNIA
jgi:hypothetical protein